MLCKTKLQVSTNVSEPLQSSYYYCMIQFVNVQHLKRPQDLFFLHVIFSVPQIEYPLGGSSKKGSHDYFLLIVAMVLLLWRQIVLLWHQITMVASEQHLYQTIVLPRKLATGSIHEYVFCYCPLVGILFEVFRIVFIISLLL